MTKPQLAVLITALIISLYFLCGEIGNVYFTRQISLLEMKRATESDTVPVVWKGVAFANDWSLQKHLLAENQNSFIACFPFIDKFPDIFSLILGCCSFSLFGYIISLFKGKNSIRSNYRFFGSMVTAILTGIVVFVLVKGVPSLFIENVNDYFPLAISLLAGLFLHRFYKLVYDKMPNIFSK